MKKLSLLLITLCSFTACSNNDEVAVPLKPVVEAPAVIPNEVNHVTTDEVAEVYPVATISIKDYGDVVADLYYDVAPNTVSNFIELANNGFYDGLTFHRVINNFMLQGGDPQGTGTGGAGYNIKGEFSANGVPNNLKHTTGVLSMARAFDPNSASSQFFIMSADAPHLDGEYAAFGKVTSGLDIIDQIESVKTNGQDKPLTDVVIEKITVDKKGMKLPTVEKIIVQ